MDDPADRMMSSAEDYGGTMEHLSLSQGYSQSHQVQGNNVLLSSQFGLYGCGGVGVVRGH